MNCAAPFPPSLSARQGRQTSADSRLDAHEGPLAHDQPGEESGNRELQPDLEVLAAEGDKLLSSMESLSDGAGPGRGQTDISVGRHITFKRLRWEEGRGEDLDTWLPADQCFSFINHSISHFAVSCGLPWNIGLVKLSLYQNGEVIHEIGAHGD